MTDRAGLPGSAGEHELQERWGTTGRASSFYRNQVLDHLNEEMVGFVARQTMVFIATADGHGEADCSFRAGDPGFVRVLGARLLAYPEYRGNGVHASLGNIVENPHIGLLFLDFFRDTIGLHVNGRARMGELEGQSRSSVGEIPVDPRAERWVMVEVDEAYIHCSKHIPRLARLDKEIDWGTDDARKKGGDYFGVKESRRAPATSD